MKRIKLQNTVLKNLSQRRKGAVSCIEFLRSQRCFGTDTFFEIQ